MDDGSGADCARVGFPMALIGGIVFGALINNMAFGIIAGLVVGFGIVTFGRSKA